MLASVATGVNRHFDLYRRWSDLVGVQSADLVEVATARDLQRATATVSRGPELPQRGILLDVKIPARSPRLPSGHSYVYLPPQYRSSAWSQRSFPVVEGFHGSPGRPSDWIAGLSADVQLDRAISSGRLPPMIVVFPPTNTSMLRSLECTNTKDGLRDEDYLTTDVHDWVASHFRANTARWTALGFSTGGYCALDLAMRHPDLFDKIISLDGYGRALHDRFARGLWRDKADRDAHSPDVWAATHRPTGQSFYLAAGTQDHEAIHDLLTTWTALTAFGWRTPGSALALEPHGKHTFPAWRQAFLPALGWALGSEPIPSAVSAAIETQLRDNHSPSAKPTQSPSPSPRPLLRQ